MPELLDDNFELPQKEKPKLPLQKQQKALQQWLSIAMVLSILTGFMAFSFLFANFDESETTIRTSLIAFSPLLRILFIILLAVSSTFCSLERRQRLAIVRKVGLPAWDNQSVSEAMAEFMVWLFLFAFVVVMIALVFVLVATILGLKQGFPLQKTTILISIGITIGAYGYRAWQLGSAYLRKDNRN